MRSYDLIELACTIREIMKEHGILRKEFKHPVLGYREIYEVTKIAIRDTYTALPVFAIRLVDCRQIREKSTCYGQHMDGLRYARKNSIRT